jgi:transcriptional regulator with XRE-family HTH domain
MTAATSRLRTERNLRGWSLTRVGGLTQIAPADLSKLERGKLPAYAGWRKRLARAYRMSEEELFDTEATR